MRITFAVLITVGCIVAPAVSGGEVYVFTVQAWGGTYDDPVLQMGRMAIFWKSDVFLHNNSEEAAAINVNVGGLSNQVQFTIPAHRTTSLVDELSQRGAELVSGEIGVAKLSLPDDVVIENTLFISAVSVSLHNPQPPLPWYGKVRLPIFSHLEVANRRQVHLDTWLGMVPSHRNVVVYNAGSSIATAVVEVRQQCDDALLYTASVRIGPGRISHVTGLPGGTLFGTGSSCARPTFVQAGVYTVITVDQPSLTLVSSVPDAKIPTGWLSMN